MLNIEWLNLHQLVFILVVLALVKWYSVGTSCKIRRDLTGKVVVITGGNTGIGKETMLDLARNHCTIVMGARDRPKSEEAVKMVTKKTGNNNIEYVPLDLGSRQSIEEFVKVVATKHPVVDILINNAGVMFVPERTLTRDGYEMQMGINHLGHFYLTSLLWKQLKGAKEPRIINVSSMAHWLCMNFKKVTIPFDDFNSEKSYDPYLAYSRSKLANVLFSKELASRLEKVNPAARSVSLHPGVVRTELLRFMRKGILDLLYTIAEPIYWLFSKSAKQGAQTTLYTAYEENDKLVNGGYYSDCTLKPTSAEACRKESPARLW